MKIQSLSIKEKIFYAFLLYSFICFSISVTSFVLFREIEKIDTVVQLVSDLKNDLQLYIRLDNEFLIYESINPEYYRTGKSVYLDQQNKLKDKINHLTDSILLSEKAYAFHFEKDIKSLKEQYQSKECIRKEIAKNIFHIGFKDYGYMGEMRKAAHYIEKFPGIDMKSLLMIRRHEKDYFLRNDSTYIQKHQAEIGLLTRNIQANKKIKADSLQTLLTQLELYNYFFVKIILLEKHTGFKNNTGLTQEMKSKTEEIDILINSITTTAERKKKDIISNIQLVIVIMVTLSIVLLLFLVASFNAVIIPSGKK